MIGKQFKFVIIINQGMNDDDRFGSFNYNFIKASHCFQSAALEGQDLKFHHHKLRSNNVRHNEIEGKRLEELAYGCNPGIYYRFRIIRVIRLQQCTYMLVTLSKSFARQTLAVLVEVHSPEKYQEASILQQCLMQNVNIRVANPFLRQNQHSFIPQLFVSSQDIIIIHSQTAYNQALTSEQIREKANNYFKNRKYVEAITLYEESLAHILGPSPRNRAILYSNTAACLFQLRLFSSCVIYADLAIANDPLYNKGYYRKINGLLQLKRYSEIVPLLYKINTLISKSEFESLNLKYTQYISCETGIFNWLSIIKGPSTPQSEYFSDKIEKVCSDDEIIYYCKEDIEQYEILLINKPLIYIRQTGSKFKESFINFLKEIQNYYLYDSLFEENIHFLPCKCHPTLKERQQYYNHYKHEAKPLPKKELFNKMQRCIFEEKSLDKCQEENGYGIWKEMFYFQNKCIPNCTGVHINSFFVVCALKSIEKGTPLSIDLIADVESTKRKETLLIKFDIECGCEICQFKQNSDIEFYNIEDLYDRFQRFETSKIKKQHIWTIINYEWEDREIYEKEFVNLIYYYIYEIEKECEWDDLLNLLRLKEQNQNVEVNRHIDEAIKRLLMKYLKLEEKDAEAVYDIVIEKYIKGMDCS